ncbi:MAG: RNA 2',3'-cyclic phosphodiesterase [Nanoarchaeota archaeon]|nr:RNA 2',3'-cyclic phosphodiesterase [Nanoarchaeota archaeon]
MRTFIAIDVPEDIKNYFSFLQKEILVPDARMRLMKSFHLTLKFLGEVKDIEEIKHKMSEISFDKFSIRLSDIGVFPDENNIRVVWVGFKESKGLQDLQYNIEQKLPEIMKEFDFYPHITLARIGYVEDKEKYYSKLQRIRIKEISFEVDRFNLYQSLLTRNGPIYSIVKSYSSKQ